MAAFEAMMEEHLRPILPPKPAPGEMEDIPAALATYEGFEALLGEDSRYTRAPTQERCAAIWLSLEHVSFGERALTRAGFSVML